MYSLLFIIILNILQCIFLVKFSFCIEEDLNWRNVHVLIFTLNKWYKIHTNNQCLIQIGILFIIFLSLYKITRKIICIEWKMLIE